MERIEQARHSYAEELRFTARVKSSAVVNAFATVPREQFVGPGPWRIKSPMDLAEYWTTDDDDPSHVYHDVLIALDEPRGINNGQPSLWAFLSARGIRSRFLRRPALLSPAFWAFNPVLTGRPRSF